MVDATVVPTYPINHLIAAIEDAPFSPKPWPHIQVQEPFTQDFYKKLRVNLPRITDMSPLGKSTPNRFLYWLVKKNGERPKVSAFWDDVRSYMFDTLWMKLEDKFGVEGKMIGAELVFDRPGYYLGPHTDTPDKLITGLFYLPQAEEDFNQGTILFHCNQGDPRGKGHGFSPEYKRVKTIPYVPNSALFFQRTDFSFHGVHPTPVERWLLCFDVFHK